MDYFWPFFAFWNHVSNTLALHTDEIMCLGMKVNADEA
jgi:hypothetical protein